MTITLLDGGMGQELVRRAGRATPLWAVQALLESPDTVSAVHDDFFAAGADVATTNTYAVTPDRLDAFGIAERLRDLTETACAIATAARDRAGHGVVAGSLGPIGFSYQPQKAPPPEVAAEIYARLAHLQASFVDVFLLETMSSVSQARGGVMGARDSGKPVWLALSVDDGDGTRLRSGEPVSDVAALVAELAPDRVLLNCSRPEAISEGLPVIAGMGRPVGAYANAFRGIDPRFDGIGATTDVLEVRGNLGPAAYAGFVARWVEQGASLVGGCCEVGPDHIAELARRYGARKGRLEARPSASSLA